MKDLIDDGEETTIALRFLAVFNFDNNCVVTFVYRSNENVKIGFFIAVENLSRNTPAEKSNRAGGTTSNINVFEFARSIESKGPTTVVLPAPMII